MSNNNKSILLVDDEPSVLSALKLLVQALGYYVVDFSNAAEALSYLKTNQQVNLCLCDLKMPKMNGMQLLAEVRQLLPDLPFVLMSAHADEADIQKARAIGSSGFLSKPFDPTELKIILERI